MILIGVIIYWIGFKQDKVVYVDAIRLMNGYKGMEDARAQFNAKTEMWQANLDTLKAEWNAAATDYEKNNGKASSRELELMKRLMESRQQQYLGYEQSIKEQYQLQDQELTQKVLGQVNDYIKRYGKEKNYKFILAATQYGNIVYAEEYVNITEEVLKGLNAEYVNK